MLVQIYVSSHGFGHTTRVAQIIRALLNADEGLRVNVVTCRPACHLFFDSDRLTFFDMTIDAGIVQSNAYTVDPEASWASLAAFLRTAESDEWREQHRLQLQVAQPNMIICDAVCPLPWSTVDREGIPRVLLSNFSFDAVFEGLIQQGEHADAQTRLVHSLVESYANGISHVYRLPGHIDMPFLQHVNGRTIKCEDMPLVYRPPTGRDKESILSDLGVASKFRQHKVLFVQFGGHQNLKANRVPSIPSGWLCIGNLHQPEDGFYRFPTDYYTPDLVSIASLVLGKLGYGTVSECVGMGVPLLMVERALFAEEAGLKAYMASHGTLAELSALDYESGDWRIHIEIIDESKQQRSVRRIVPDGSAEVAKSLYGLLTHPACG